MNVFSIGPLRDMLEFLVTQTQDEEMKVFIQAKGEEWIQKKKDVYDEAKKNGQTPY